MIQKSSKGNDLQKEREAIKHRQGTPLATLGQCAENCIREIEVNFSNQAWLLKNSHFVKIGEIWDIENV
jgi:hypothetical protein